MISVLFISAWAFALAFYCVSLGWSFWAATWAFWGTMLICTAVMTLEERR